MRNLLIILCLLCMASNTAFAGRVPKQMQDYVSKEFSDATFRFDGLVIMPDNTLYLPLFPAKDIEVENLEITKTFPEGKSIKDKPDVVIFNDDFVLLKVLVDENEDKTVYGFDSVPVEVKTGLLPQDLLVPSRLVIPENLKSIVGGLNIETSNDGGIRVLMKNVKKVFTPRNSRSSKKIMAYPELKEKSLYVASPYSKNIHVLSLGEATPEYAFSQVNIPISMKAYEEFLLVSNYDKLTVDVISLADDKVIKQINIKTQPDDILIDSENKIAYVVSANSSSVFLVNLDKMTLMRELKVTGMPTRAVLSDDGSKLFYFDKKTGNIWAVELDNKYLLKEIGRFPNVSKIAFSNNKLYITSRTKNHLAVIDYDTIGVIAELTVCEKPVDLLEFNEMIYIIGATENVIQILDTAKDEVIDTINLNTDGFSTKIYHVDGTNMALITDSKLSLYTIFDLEKNEVVENVLIDVPINSVITTKKVQKIND
ncbi:MAG: hypothetical protein R3Y28_05400 [Candidatus Gastranaerophilales bacterium]